MKHIKKIQKVILLVVVLVSSSFTIFQLTQEKDLIIGEWKSIEDNNWKLILIIKENVMIIIKEN